MTPSRSSSRSAFPSRVSTMPSSGSSASSRTAPSTTRSARGREVRAYERWWHGERESSGAADEVLLKEESAGELRQALEGLPDGLKAVLVLKEYGGLNYKEIGRTLGISEGNVKVRAFRAREALLSRLGEGSKHVS